MKLSILLICAVFFAASTAFAGGGSIHSRDRSSDRWVSYDIKTDASLHMLNRAWSSAVCFSGAINVAAAIIRKMAKNEEVPSSVTDDEGRVYRDIFQLHANAGTQVITLKVRTYDEYGGYVINRMIRRCENY